MDQPGRLAGIVDVSDAEIDRLAAGLIQGSLVLSSSRTQLRRAGLVAHADAVHAWLGEAAEVFGSTESVIAALRS